MSKMKHRCPKLGRRGLWGTVCPCGRVPYGQGSRPSANGKRTRPGEADGDDSAEAWPGSARAVPRPDGWAPLHLNISPAASALDLVQLWRCYSHLGRRRRGRGGAGPTAEPGRAAAAGEGLQGQAPLRSNALSEHELTSEDPKEEERKRKRRERSRTYYAANAAKIREKYRAYKAANEAKIRERNRAYRDKRKERERKRACPEACGSENLP